MVRILREDGEAVSRTLSTIDNGKELELHTLRLIKGGNNELWICSPYISDIQLGVGASLSYFMKKMIKRGKKVILITKNLEQHKSFLEDLHLNGVEIFILNGLHAKILFFVRSKRPAVIFGSANVTKGGFRGNYEYSILTDIENITSNVEGTLKFLKRISTPLNKI